MFDKTEDLSSSAARPSIGKTKALIYRRGGRFVFRSVSNTMAPRMCDASVLEAAQVNQERDSVEVERAESRPAVGSVTPNSTPMSESC